MTLVVLNVLVLSCVVLLVVARGCVYGRGCCCGRDRGPWTAVAIVVCHGGRGCCCGGGRGRDRGCTSPSRNECVKKIHNCHVNNRNADFVVMCSLVNSIIIVPCK